MRKENNRLDIRLSIIAWNKFVVEKNILISNADNIGEKEGRKLIRSMNKSKQISDLLIGFNDPGYNDIPPQKKFNYN